MQMLRQRNKIWNEQIQNYLPSVFAECLDGKASSILPSNLRVSLALLGVEFQNVVYMDHFFLGTVRVFHMMDVAMHFSVCALVDSTSMENVIYRMKDL